ncbi:SufS family cysteine desulfurase [Candidatus Daviesbacteria bacterium]|nr:SufS family cysteine desulfurase [Candidatus Daviesbacteria bacterium]
MKSQNSKVKSQKYGRKDDFPILRKSSRKLIYFDSASTSLKPKQVIKAVTDFYEQYSANVHRGIYWESEEATRKYEEVRDKAAKLINAEREEIIFTKNTTESINLVAKTLRYCHSERSHARGGRSEESPNLFEAHIRGRSFALRAQDDKKNGKILVSVMEHHSNLVPWQIVISNIKEQKSKMDFLDINKEGELDLSGLDKKLKGVDLVAITHVSNVLGTINPVEEITKKAHQAGALVLIDGAQAVPHMKVDVKKLGCDFYAFSAHKMLGPSGVGVLWMRKSIAQSLSPFLTGGGMVSKVSLKEVQYLDSPQKFEAGTPNIEGVIGFGAAIDYLQKLGMDKVREHEKSLTEYALEKLQKVQGLNIYGPLEIQKRGGIISFNLAGVHPHDVASLLDQDGIAVRAGSHCAMPLHQRLGVKSSVRISFYIYNNLEDVDKLVTSLRAISEAI